MHRFIAEGITEHDLRQVLDFPGWLWAAYKNQGITLAAAAKWSLGHQATLVLRKDKSYSPAEQALVELIQANPGCWKWPVDVDGVTILARVEGGFAPTAEADFTIYVALPCATSPALVKEFKDLGLVKSLAVSLREDYYSLGMPLGAACLMGALTPIKKPKLLPRVNKGRPGRWKVDKPAIGFRADRAKAVAAMHRVSARKFGMSPYPTTALNTMFICAEWVGRSRVWYYPELSERVPRLNLYAQFVRMAEAVEEILSLESEVALLPAGGAVTNADARSREHELYKAGRILVGQLESVLQYTASVFQLQELLDQRAALLPENKIPVEYQQVLDDLDARFAELTARLETHSTDTVMNHAAATEAEMVRLGYQAANDYLASAQLERGQSPR